MGIFFMLLFNLFSAIEILLQKEGPKTADTVSNSLLTLRTRCVQLQIRLLAPNLLAKCVAIDHQLTYRVFGRILENSLSYIIANNEANMQHYYQT